MADYKALVLVGSKFSEIPQTTDILNVGAGITGGTADTLSITAGGSSTDKTITIGEVGTAGGASNIIHLFGASTDTDAGTLKVHGLVEIDGDLDVTGNETITGTSTFAQNAAFNGTVTFGDGLASDNVDVISFNSTSSVIGTDLPFQPNNGTALYVKAKPALAGDTTDAGTPIGLAAGDAGSAYAGAGANIILTPGDGTLASRAGAIVFGVLDDTEVDSYEILANTDASDASKAGIRYDHSGGTWQIKSDGLGGWTNIAAGSVISDGVNDYDRLYWNGTAWNSSPHMLVGDGVGSPVRMYFPDTTATTVNGSTLSFEGQIAGTEGDGGGISVTTGPGGASVGAADGGDGGTFLTTGGVGGAGDATNQAGRGGPLSFIGGAAGTAGVGGGNIGGGALVRSGAGTGVYPSGTVTIDSGIATSNDSGPVTMTSGTATTGDSGDVTVKSGVVSSTGTSGDVNVYSAAATSGTYGTLRMFNQIALVNAAADTYAQVFLNSDSDAFSDGGYVTGTRFNDNMYWSYSSDGVVVGMEKSDAATPGGPMTFRGGNGTTDGGLTKISSGNGDAGHGGHIQIQTGSSGGTAQDGGEITINSGDGTAGGGSGGNVIINLGDGGDTALGAGGAGGSFTVNAGAGGDDNATGGNINLHMGPGGDSAGTNGQIFFGPSTALAEANAYQIIADTGDATAEAGFRYNNLAGEDKWQVRMDGDTTWYDIVTSSTSADVQAGTDTYQILQWNHSTTTWERSNDMTLPESADRTISIEASTTGAGDALTISAGAAYGTGDNAGGDLNLYSGALNGAEASGNVDLASADASSTTSDSGTVDVHSGEGLGDDNGTGAVSVYSGDAVANTSGNVSLYSGEGTGTGGGSGTLLMRTGDAFSGSTGTVTLESGDGVTAGALGISVGGSSTGKPGALSIQGGDTSPGNTNAAGTLTIRSGASLSADGGPLSIDGGDGLGGDGGSVSIEGGQGGSGDGGDVTVNAGQGSVANGTILLGDENTLTVQFGGDSSTQINFMGDSANRVISDIVFDDASAKSIYVEDGDSQGALAIWAQDASGAGQDGGDLTLRGGDGTTGGSGGAALLWGGTGTGDPGPVYVGSDGSTYKAVFVDIGPFDGTGHGIRVLGPSQTSPDAEVAIDGIIEFGESNPTEVFFDSTNTRVRGNIIFSNSESEHTLLADTDATTGVDMIIRGGACSTAGAGGNVKLLTGVSTSGSDGSVVFGAYDNPESVDGYQILANTIDLAYQAGLRYNNVDNKWQYRNDSASATWADLVGSGGVLPESQFLYDHLEGDGAGGWEGNNAGLTLPNGADRTITVQQSSAAGHDLILEGGAMSTTQNGGGVQILGSAGGTAGIGGSVTATGANGSVGGGDVTLTAGSQTVDLNDGADFTLLGGQAGSGGYAITNGGDATGTGDDGGYIQLLAGAGTAVDSGDGGYIQLSGGATASAGAGGDVRIVGGLSASGTDGSVHIYQNIFFQSAGAGNTYGRVNLQGENLTNTSASSDYLTGTRFKSDTEYGMIWEHKTEGYRIAMENAPTGTGGGLMTFQAGAGDGAGSAGGGSYIRGGAAGTGATGGVGGSVNLIAPAGGAGTTTLAGAGGPVNVTTGAGGASTLGAGPDGGDMVVTLGAGGAGSGAGGTGGDFRVTTGAGGTGVTASGAPGSIYLLCSPQTAETAEGSIIFGDNSQTVVDANGYQIFANTAGTAKGGIRYNPVDTQWEVTANATAEDWQPLATGASLDAGTVTNQILEWNHSTTTWEPKLDLTLANSADRTITIEASTTARSLTVAGHAAVGADDAGALALQGGAAVTGDGGHVTITGGISSGGTNGGTVTINGGSAGAAPDGNVWIGTATTSGIRIGATANHVAFSNVSTPPMMSFTGTANINLPGGSATTTENFQIDGSNVGEDVTAANLNTLTDNSDATGLHFHTAGVTAVTYTQLASETIASGAVAVSKYDTGNTRPGLYNADMLTASGDGFYPAGIILTGGNSGDTLTVYVAGEVTLGTARFDSAPVVGDVGKPVFASPNNAGQFLPFSDVGDFAAGDERCKVGILTDHSTAKMLIQIGEPISITS